MTDSSIMILQNTEILLRDYLSRENIETIVRWMDQAATVHFYDLPTRSYTFLLQNLVLTGKNADLISLYPEMLSDSAVLSQDSLVFSLPLEYPDMMDMTEIYKNVRSHHAKLILCVAVHSTCVSKYETWQFGHRKRPMVADK